MNINKAFTAASALFRPSLLPIISTSVLRSPTYNQRKARKARRQRYAAGDRHAFKR